MSLSRLSLLSLILALAVLAGGGIDELRAQSAAPTYTPGEETPEEFPPGPGREETFYTCVACHNFKLVAAQGMSRERWDETLNFMTSRHGMPAVEGADRQLILDYLTTAFPARADPRPGWRSPFAP